MAAPLAAPGYGAGVKILCALHAFAPETHGGTERTVQALSHAMQRAGHELLIVAGALQPAASAELEPVELPGLRLLRLHRSDLYYEDWYKAWSPEASAAFAALLARERPDVVHVHHWIRLSSDLARLARAAGARVAITLHDYYSVLARPIRMVGEDRVQAPPALPFMNETERAEAFALHRDDFLDELRAAHLLYAVSRSHADAVAQFLPEPVAPIAVSRPPLLAVPPRAVRPAQPGRRLVSWGSIYPAKGTHVLLDALRRLGPDSGVTLDLFGGIADPAYGEQLRQQAQGLAVRFHGRFTHEDLARCEADFAVFPSVCHESYGLTLDEAACFGWPVLAADLPSYAERIPDGTGLRFRAGDAADLARLLADPRLAALRPAEPDPWTAEQAVAQLLADYERVQPGGALPPPRVTDARRIRHLWRRGEWRLHLAYFRADPYAPPEDFPA